MSTANPFMPASELKHSLQLSVSKQTIRNRLKEKGLNSYVAVKKEVLKPIHKQKRLEFALKYENWTFNEWKKVCFSDEKLFSTFGKGIRRVWRFKHFNPYDEKYINFVGRSGRSSIPVWACISVDFKAIHCIRTNTLNNVYYIAHILENYIPSLQDDVIFMHDRSPIHTSRNVINWIDNKQLQVLDWPAKSPDLNPIENVWAEMERLTNNRHVSTKEELWELIENTFSELLQEYIEKLIKSMPNRIRKVIESRGNWTKY
ncbi:transposable element Tc1 transposase [Caerostris darwini]|uniref:Transposable element Tc1 transposase n=1 Tax=Caerostris darwini TaxID=1538125 RepID=A0AAV4SU58_9ARAC|nr:transposable element Tc1 transposase [Caerostris darwini]